MIDIYEPTDADRAAALWQAERIAKDVCELIATVNIHDIGAVLTAKIEAAILAEVVMRGTASTERS